MSFMWLAEAVAGGFLLGAGFGLCVCRQFQLENEALRMANASLHEYIQKPYDDWADFVEEQQWAR